MNGLAAIIKALSTAAWPALAFWLVFYFRENIKTLILAMKDQILSGAAIRWKDFEFKGVDLSSNQKLINDFFAESLPTKTFSTKDIRPTKKTKTFF